MTPGRPYLDSGLIVRKNRKPVTGVHLSVVEFKPDEFWVVFANLTHQKITVKSRNFW